MAGPHWERSFNANSSFHYNSPDSVNQISRFFHLEPKATDGEQIQFTAWGNFSSSMAPFPEQSCPVLLFYWSGFRKEALDPWSIFSIYMVHPGCGINGGGESETEGEQYRVRMMTPDLPVSRPQCIILLMGNTPVRGPWGQKKKHLVFQNILHISVWRNMHPFCVFAVRYSRRRRGVVRLFKNKKPT